MITPIIRPSKERKPRVIPHAIALAKNGESAPPPGNQPKEVMDFAYPVIIGNFPIENIPKINADIDDIININIEEIIIKIDIIERNAYENMDRKITYVIETKICGMLLCDNIDNTVTKNPHTVGDANEIANFTLLFSDIKMYHSDQKRIFSLCSF